MKDHSGATPQRSPVHVPEAVRQLSHVETEALARFLRASAWMAIKFGLSRDEFLHWASVAWKQEQE